jgi:hypothetical protein
MESLLEYDIQICPIQFTREKRCDEPRGENKIIFPDFHLFYAFSALLCCNNAETGPGVDPDHAKPGAVEKGLDFPR